MSSEFITARLEFSGQFHTLIRHQAGNRHAECDPWAISTRNENKLIATVIGALAHRQGEGAGNALANAASSRERIDCHGTTIALADRLIASYWRTVILAFVSCICRN